jgi:hypothetical protein
VNFVAIGRVRVIIESDWEEEEESVEILIEELGEGGRAVLFSGSGDSGWGGGGED